MMSVKAYVFIKTEVGKSNGVHDALKKVPGVRDADLITGEYDIAAVVNVEELRDIQGLVTESIQSIGGVQRTKTMIATLWHE